MNVTSSTGWASAAAAIAASDAANDNLADHSSFFLVYYNTTSTKVELAYVSDAGDAAGGRCRQ